MCDTYGMAKKGRRATNEERLAAIQMYDNGLTADQIAEILDVGRSSVFDWVSKYREGGLASISTKFASGRPTALDDSEMIRLYTMINGKDPRAYSFGMALWTRALIRDLIKKVFVKNVSLITVGRILKNWDVAAAAVVPGMEAGPATGGEVEARRIPRDQGTRGGGGRDDPVR